MRGKGFRIMVATILSTVLHFFILTLLDTIPLISKEIPPQPNLYMVDLVSLPSEQPAPQKEEESAVQQRVEEVKKEEVKKEEVKEKEVIREEVKEEVKKEEVKEVEKKEEVKKEDKPVAADAGTEQEKKEKVEEQPLDLEEQRLAAIERIRQKRETDGVPTADYDYNKLENQVKSFWAIPDTVSEEGLKAVVIIEIDKNGELVKTEFEQSSGNVIFDQAVIRAIRKAAPFDSPVGSVSLKIGLRFP